MTKIYIGNNSISCVGHAGNKIACAMLTALTYSLVDNVVNRLDYHGLSYDLEPGLFIVDYENASGAVLNLIDAFVYSVRRLSEDYPENFKIETTER